MRKKKVGRPKSDKSKKKVSVKITVDPDVLAEAELSLNVSGWFNELGRQIYKVRLYAMGEENSLATSMHIGMEYRLYCYDVSEARVHPKSEDFVLLQRLCGAMSELSEEVLYNDESIVVYGTNK
ncbi:MAG: hypothetical protein NTX25_12195 [Proteobacteria bacterium]|nr:hypothetical protein [Pseudomonadota bacterium]